MFLHNFKYTLKTFVKNKSLMFWTLAFPLILATFFNMAFSNIDKNEKMSAINIAIVKNEKFSDNKLFSESLKILGDKNNENHLFNIKYVNEKKAKKLLNDDEVTAYLLFENDTPKIITTSSGISVTILKYVIEEISQINDIVNAIAENQMKEKNSIDINLLYSNIYSKVMEILNEDSNIKNNSKNNLSYTVIEFYSLIAMTCLYGGTISMVSINQSLANMSNKGKRIEISPTKKSTIIISSILSSYIVQLLGIALLLIYTVFVLKVDYGSNLPLAILLSIVGGFAGLSIGIVTASILKTNENTKIGVIISVSMLCSFLSGMMGISMKYVIDKYFPIINKLNPASMITDGFYSLYYYDTLNRFYFNLISLLIFSLLMVAISILSLRRQKYDSI